MKSIPRLGRKLPPTGTPASPPPGILPAAQTTPSLKKQQTDHPASQDAAGASIPTLSQSTLRPPERSIHAAPVARQPPGPPPIINEDKMAAMMNADAVTAGSGLEGAQLKDTADLMVRELQALGTGRIFDLSPVRTQLDGLTDDNRRLSSWAAQMGDVFRAHERSPRSGAADPAATQAARALMTDIRQAIEELPNGKPLWIPAGWYGGIGSHAMVSKWTRHSDLAGGEACYSAKLFDTGGAQQFRVGAPTADGTKIKRQAIVARSNIPAANLGTANEPSLQLRALHEPRMIPAQSGSYSADDIHSLVFPALGGTPDPVDADLANFFTGQRSGSCSWKVLLAVLRDSLERDDYKRVKLEIQTATLLGFLEHVQTSAQPTASQAYVLEKGVAKLRRSALKLVGRKLMSHAQLAVLEGLVGGVDEAVASYRATALVTRPPPSHWHDVKALEPTSNRKILPEPRPLSTPRTGNVPTLVAAYVTPPARQQLDALPMAPRLEACLTYAQACLDAKTPAAFAAFMDGALRAMPIPTPGQRPDPAWDIAEPLALADTLTKLFDHYTTAAIASDVSTDGHQIVSLFKLLAAVDKTCRRALDITGLRVQWQALLGEALQSPLDPVSAADQHQVMQLWQYFAGDVDPNGQDAGSHYLDNYRPKSDELVEDSADWLLLSRMLKESPTTAEALGEEVSTTKSTSERLAPLHRDLGDGKYLRGNARALGLLRRAFFVTDTMTKYTFASWSVLVRSGQLVKPGFQEVKQHNRYSYDYGAPQTVTYRFALDNSRYTPAQRRARPEYREQTLTDTRRMLLLEPRGDGENALILNALGMPGDMRPAERRRIALEGNHAALRIPLTLAHFTTHLNALKDAQARRELEICLDTKTTSTQSNTAKPAAPLLWLHELPQALPQLSVLLERAFEVFGQVELDLPAALFFCRLAGTTRQTARYLERDVDVPNPQMWIDTLLSDTRVQRGERAAVWQARLATLAFDAENPTDEILLKALEAGAEARLFNPPKTFSDPTMQQQATYNALTLAPHLERRLADPALRGRVGGALDAVLARYGEMPEAGPQWSGDFPLLSRSPFTVNLATGEIFKGGTPYKLELSDAVRDWPAYKAVLGDAKPVMHLEDGVYHIGTDVRMRVPAGGRSRPWDMSYSDASLFASGLNADALSSIAQMSRPMSLGGLMGGLGMDFARIPIEAVLDDPQPAQTPPVTASTSRPQLPGSAFSRINSYGSSQYTALIKNMLRTMESRDLPPLAPVHGLLPEMLGDYGSRVPLPAVHPASRIPQDGRELLHKRLTLNGQTAWFQYHPAADFSTELPQALRTDHLIWRGLEPGSPALLITNLEGEPAYTGELTVAGLQIRAFSTPAVGAELLPKRSIPPALTRFETDDHILLWRQDGALSSLELPRYGLRFDFDRDGKARWQDDPNFWLTLSPSNAFTHYADALELQSDAGARKLIVPWAKLTRITVPGDPYAVKLRTEPHRPAQRPDRTGQQPQRNQLRYNVANVGSAGQLSTQSPVTHLQLAGIKFDEREYASALHHLRAARSLTAWGNDAWQLVYQISQFAKDAKMGDPNAAAVVAHLACIVADNLRGDALDKAINAAVPYEQRNHGPARTLSELQANFTTYLSTLNNVDAALQLTPHEERLALGLLATSPGQLQQRLDYLRSGATAVPVPPSGPRQPPDKSGYDLARQLGTAMRLGKDNAPALVTVPILLPGAKFQSCWAEAFAVATDGTPEEKKQLRLRLDLMSPEAGQTNLNLKRCLLAALHAPEEAKRIFVLPEDRLSARVGQPTSDAAPDPYSAATLSSLRLGINELPAEIRARVMELSASETERRYRRPGYDADEFEREVRYFVGRMEALNPPAVPNIASIPNVSWSDALKEPTRGQAAPQVQADSTQPSAFTPLAQRVVREVRTAVPPAPPTQGRWPIQAPGVLGEQARLLQQNLEVYAEQSGPTLSVRREDLPEIRTALAASLERFGIDELRDDIERIANSGASEGEQLQHNVEIEGREVAALTVGDCQAAFLRGDLTTLRQRNRWLTDDALETLGGQLQQYMLDTTSHQQAARVVARMDTLKLDVADAEGQAAADIGLQEIAALLSAKRRYDPRANPELLVFECEANMLLRPDQVKTLQQLQSLDDAGKYPELIQQLNMGSGKTKILLPLLALKKADGNRLPIVIVPRDLVDVNQADLQDTSDLIFGQSAQAFFYERGQPCTIEKLQHLVQMTADIKAQRQYLVTTRESVQSFKLQYLSYLSEIQTAKGEQAAELMQKITMMRSVLRTWRDDGHVHLDEADLLLDVKNELNYSHGAPKGLDPDRIDVVTSIYRVLSTDPDVRALVNLQENHQNLMQAADYTGVARRVAERVLDTHPKVSAVVTPADREALLDYLLSAKGTPPGCVEMLHAAGAVQVTDLLAVMKEQFTTLLPLTLGRSGGENYGPSEDPACLYAIPYAKSRPVHGAQFGNIYETLNYTLQMYLQRGVESAPLFEMLTVWQERVKNEIQQEEGDYAATAGAKAFAAIVEGTPLASYTLFDFKNADSSEMETLQKILRGSPDKLFAVLERFILPTIEMYGQQLTSNASDLVETFACVQGFSGTTWNSSTYPARLHTNTRPDTDGIVTKILFNPQKTAVQQVSATDVSGMLTSLEVGGNLRHAHALIDTGALFKDLPNEAVARDVAAFYQVRKKSGIEAVLYFDDRTNKLTLLKIADGSTRPMSGSDPASLASLGFTPEQVFAFYDQAHTTGTDLPLPITARGLLTLSESTLLRDLQQGALRLRALAAAQKLTLVVPEHVAPVLRDGSPEDPGVREICHLALANQSRLLGADKVRAIKQAMRNHVYNTAFQACLNAEPHQQPALFAALTPLLVTFLEDAPYVQFGASEDAGTSKVLSAYAKALEARVAACVEDLPWNNPAYDDLVDVRLQLRDPSFIKTLTANVGVLPMVSRKSGFDGVDTQQEVQCETEAETNTERATETQTQSYRHLRGAGETGWDVQKLYTPSSFFGAPGTQQETASDIKALLNAWNVSWIRPVPASLRSTVASGNSPASTKATAFEMLNAHAKASVFDAHLAASSQWLQVLSSEANGLFKPYQKPVSFFIALREPSGDTHFVAVTAEEANRIVLELSESDEEKSRAVCLFDSNGKPWKNGSPGFDEAFFDSEELLRAVVQFKAISQTHTGELLLPARQRALYDAWMAEGTAENQRQRALLLGIRK